MRLSAWLAAQEMLHKEVKNMRELQHPNILQLKCAFVWEKQLWMVLPYVAGGSMASIMRHKHPTVRPSNPCPSCTKFL
jgi:serine/threonine-protein kinase OSR1/STK39